MKKLKKFNIILAVFLAVLSIISFCISGNFNYLIFILALTLPFIFKISPILTCVYLIYVYMTASLGLITGWFKMTTWYDSYTHFLWGILSSFLAIYILQKFKMFDEKNILFNMLFIFVFTLATAGFWEIIEFMIDNVFGRDMQRVETGVFDTMKDIIVTVLGNVLFLLDFYYEYKDNHELLIKKIKKEW